MIESFRAQKREKREATRQAESEESARDRVAEATGCR